MFIYINNNLQHRLHILTFALPVLTRWTSTKTRTKLITYPTKSIKPKLKLICNYKYTPYNHRRLRGQLKLPLITNSTHNLLTKINLTQQTTKTRQDSLWHTRIHHSLSGICPDKILAQEELSNSSKVPSQTNF